MKANTPTVDAVRSAARRYHSTAQAAQALGVQPTSLRRLLKRFDIQPRWKDHAHA